MKKRNPDYHGYRVMRSATRPEHALEAAFWDLHQNAVPVDIHVKWAWDIYEVMSERETMQAFIIAGASDEVVKQTLRIPPQVTQAYRYLFFNMDAFRDVLHLHSWLRAYEEERRGTQAGAQLLKNAVTLGVNWLQHTYGGSGLTIDPAAVQRAVMTDAYFRGQAQRMFAIHSDEGKAAKGYLDMASKLATVLTKTPDNSGISALLIRLRHRDDTTPVEEVREDDVPLH